MKNKFSPKKLATIISLALLSPNIYSAVVRNDIDYQYFRDFAENKGKFHVNATNIPIYDKSGNLIGHMLENAPMIDFSVADRSGIATLIAPQYVSSVAHNSGYTSVQFGAQGKNFDAHHYSYRLVDRNNYPNNQPLNHDYHIPRLSKLVTETEAIPVSSAGLDAKQYLPSSKRFSEYVRVGSGTQYIRTPNNHNTRVAGPYHYLIGGNSLDMVGNRYGWLDAKSNLFHSKTGVMATYGLPGDSGSPVFAFDTQEKRWVLIGVLNFHTGESASGNVYSISRADYIREKLNEDIAGNITSSQAENQFTWSSTNSASSAASRLLTSAVTNRTDLSGLNAGKSLYFNGDKGTLTLTENINQGAGALYFDTHFTVKGSDENTTWLGAGVSVAEGKEVIWQVHNPKGDRLSKIGKGILHVNGTGRNEGDISVGDGLVFLAQKPDANGHTQAFNQIGITSGRATVTIGGENQFDPNNLYFGFRGGRLNVNGYDLTFDRIQNSDDGARIVNNNLDKPATLTIQGFVPTEKDIQWERWGKQATSRLSLYEYSNQWRWYRKDYFRLVGNPERYYPIDNSDSNWEFLGSDKTAAIKKVLERFSKYQAFDGFLGETDLNHPNGELNVNYAPRNDQLLLLSGGTELNGRFSVSNGTVVLSGRPTPHARDHLKNRDVEKDDDWMNREFNASEFSVANEGKLYVGRNVSQMNANIKGSNNSTISIGFIQSQIPLCTRSDYTGEMGCEQKAVLTDAIFEQLPQTQVRGNVALSGNSHFSLGKAHLKGKIDAQEGTRVSLNQDSEWTLTADSQVNHLEMNGNAQITLNSQYHQISKEQAQNGVSQFSTLTLGNLTGNGRFNFLSNAGIGQSDRITVNGIASGVFTLKLKNTGAEPTSASPLNLVSLRNSAQTSDKVSFLLDNHYVDLGAYRYVLKQEKNNYRLYSPVKDAVLKATSSAPTEQAVNSAIDSANKALNVVIELSKQIAQRSEEKLFAEQQVVRKAREEQIARKKEADYRNQARWRLLPYRKREALNMAEKAMEEAQRAQNAATEFTALATQREKEIAMMKTALAEAKRKAEDAEKIALKLAYSSNSALSPENISGASLQLCSAHGISENECNTLLEAFDIPKNEALTHKLSEKIDDINIQLSEKVLAKQGLQSSLAVYDDAVFKENAKVKYYKDQAARRWSESKKNNDFALAYQAYLRLQDKLREREKIVQKIMVLDNEIALLQHSLHSAEEIRATLPASAPMDDTAIENAMMKVDALSEQYNEAKANFDAIERTFNDEKAALSEQELANRQAELELAKNSLLELAQALENAKTEEAESFLMLRSARTASAQPMAAAPNYQQRDVISQYANSALSDASAQINSLLHINQEMHNRLISDSTKEFEVWANYGVMSNQYHSELFRNYSQRNYLNQLGVEHKVGENIKVGAIFSQSRSRNEFDDGFNGKARLNMMSLYAKADLGYGVTGAVDFSYGQTKNRLSQGELTTNFKRHIYQAGLTLAKKWEWNGISLQPALNAHYQHLSRSQYGLELANVESDRMHFMSYGASFKIAKTFDFNGIKVTPSWQSQYIDASHKDFTLKVNDQALKQKFGRYAQHQFDVALKLKNWEVVTRVGLLNGNQTKHHKFASLNVGYSW